MANCRPEILARLRALSESGRPVVRRAAGGRPSVKCEEVGVIDLIVIYNTGPCRVAGRGSCRPARVWQGQRDCPQNGARGGAGGPTLAGINGRGPLCLFDAFLEGLKRMILVHGAPVADAEDAEFILASTKNCHGFYGAYSIERLLTEKAMVERAKRFKAIPSARKM